MTAGFFLFCVRAKAEGKNRQSKSKKAFHGYPFDVAKNCGTCISVGIMKNGGEFVWPVAAGRGNVGFVVHPHRYLGTQTAVRRESLIITEYGEIGNNGNAVLTLKKPYATLTISEQGGAKIRSCRCAAPIWRFRQ